MALSHEENDACVGFGGGGSVDVLTMPKEFEIGQVFQTKEDAVLSVKNYSTRRGVKYKVKESDHAKNPRRTPPQIRGIIITTGASVGAITVVIPELAAKMVAVAVELLDGALARVVFQRVCLAFLLLEFCGGNDNKRGEVGE
ncbi:hypothetical protein PIB30_041805 [Stylosanthes scabra]|uniref:Uncharacterized protein n=1 Tax=Stylosanthes scabra TaxID=79078 RepID=A0ABU6YGZ3_9FABA|nr:hypothetical protein [Stylosanthes scabra]